MVQTDNSSKYVMAWTYEKFAMKRTEQIYGSSLISLNMLAWMMVKSIQPSH
jgi:hypothetical protein